MRKKLVSLILILMILVTYGCSESNNKSDSTEFPKGPITITVPWAAGGTSDGQIRAIAEIGQHEDYFGVPINVVNRDGAGGTIATTEFKTASADGYNICLEAIGVFTTQPFMRDVNYKFEDFKPIIGTTLEPIVMVASKSSGFTSVEDLKNANRSISYGFSGSGSLVQLAQQKFFEDAGIESDAIPFDGGAPTITALLGGHIDTGAAHPGEIQQYLDSGDLVPIGIFSPNRDERDEFKDIPTFLENGYDIDMSVWKFLIVPKDTPDEIAQKLTEILDRIMQDQKFVDYCAANSLIITRYKPDVIKQKVQEEAEINRQLLSN